MEDQNDIQDTTSNNTRIAKNTIFLYVRSIVLLLINLYTSRLTLQVLGVEDFGIYQVVGGVVSMFSMLSSTLASASQRFITYALGERHPEKLNSVFSTCITLHLILGLIVVVLLEVLGVWFLNTKLNIPTERLYIAGLVMQFSIATFFVNVISVPYNAVIIAHEKMSAFAYIGILEGVLKLCAVLGLQYVRLDKLLFYSLIYFCIAVLLRIIYSIYSRTHFDEVQKFQLKINRRQFKEMFSFAGWNLIGSSALVFRNQGIDILLNLFFGVTINAAKGVCNQVQSAVHQLVGNFTTAVRPQLVQSIAKNEYSRAHSLIFRGGKMSFMLMMIIAVPFIICCEDLLSIWLTEVPEYSVLMIQITFIYLLADTLSKFLIDSVLAYGVIKWFQIVQGGIKMLAVPLTWLLIKITDSPYSGVIVVTIIQLICLFGDLYFANKYVSVDWKSYLIKVVLRCWFTFGISFIFVYLVFSYLPASIIIKLPVSIGVSLCAVLIWGVDKNEISGIKHMFKRKS